MRTAGSFAAPLPLLSRVFLGALLSAVLACGSGPSPGPVTPATEAAPDATRTPDPDADAGVKTTAETSHPKSLAVDPAQATARAPDRFAAQFMTTKGNFVIEVRRSWAPHGADRFFNLVSSGIYDDSRFFRAIPGFMVQFGIPGDPAVAAKWEDANIQDDPVTQSNRHGFVTFAQTNTPNSRSTQVFVNYGDNSQLDASNFAPFGRVTQGMDVVESLYKGYGEGAPNGEGPSQGRIQSEGNTYLDREFPKLDRILSAKIVPVATP